MRQEMPLWTCVHNLAPLITEVVAIEFVSRGIWERAISCSSSYLCKLSHVSRVEVNLFCDMLSIVHVAINVDILVIVEDEGRDVMELWEHVCL